MAIITLNQIEKRFGNSIAVSGINLDVAEGEFLTLLGPSGCGKTTLLRMIGGFETPSSGHITIDGKDVTGTPPNKRAVNTVFQDYALFPHMTVVKNVEFGLSVAGVHKANIKAMVEEALTLVELTHRSNAMPGQLSGGQRQRVALARALVKHPKVLLLDEPLSALDANLRQHMQIELKRLQRKLGITFIMVTHDQEEAMVMSDRIVVMLDGKIEQIAPPQTLYDQPKTAFVASFFGTSSLLNGTVKAKSTNKQDYSGFIEIAVNEVNFMCLTPPGAALMDNMPVTISIRPERIKCSSLDQATSKGLNVMQGIIQSVIFHGGMLRLRIEVGTISMLCDVGRQEAETMTLEIGAPIVISILPEDIVLLAGSQTHH